MVTERDREEMRLAAASGDEVAKAALAALPQESAPEPEKAEPVKDVKVGTEEKPKEEVKAETPEPKPEAPKVDQPQEKPESRQRERVHPAVRRLDREKRELQRALQKQQEDLAALRKAVEESRTPATKETEADELNRLLSDPGKYLAERDKRLVENMRKQMLDEQRRNVQEMARNQVERENALKIINSIEGYDDKRDSDDMLSVTAEYLNEVYDTDRYDEEEVAQLWRETPGVLAPVMRKAWLKSRRLDEKVKSDKKAASAAPTETGKTPGGVRPSLADLNAQLAKAVDRSDKKAVDEIMAKIAEELGEKKQ